MTEDTVNKDRLDSGLHPCSRAGCEEFAEYIVHTGWGLTLLFCQKHYDEHNKRLHEFEKKHG